MNRRNRIAIVLALGAGGVLAATELPAFWRPELMGTRIVKASELRTQFDLTRSDDFSMHIDPDEVDLDGRALKFSLSQPAGRAELRVFDSADKEIGFVTMCCGGGLGTGTLIQRV